MDTYEATRAVLTRIQNLDPDNASKIMGMLLIQDHGEKEMIRLAFGPESLLQSVVLKARKDLGLASNSPSTPSTPSSPSPFPANNHHHTAALSRQNSASSRLPSPLSIPNHSSLSSSSWATSCFSDFQTHDDLISPSSNSTSPFYGNGGTHDLIDDFQLQDQLSFLNDGSSSPNFHPKGSNFLYPYQDLANNSNWGSDESTCGFGWKPCLYYARGYCKNGNTCRFLHGDLAAPGEAVAAGVVENSQDLLRSKQRLAAVASSFPYSSALAANKCMNLLLQHHQSDTQRAAAAALMMGEDMHKLGRSRLERNDFSMSPGSRQIYLTFPADSTFREEDVSNYFSIYGPVQDVRIPYQQKRMFGFVTFVYPDTVKMILAKGNPHFVCDARVLVKPYKEKGKIPDKFRKQPQIERGDFSACGSPTGLDSRSDPFDLQLGARLFGNGNSQDILWRRKLEEQAEMQQAIELQGRRLMSLQLLDVKRQNPHGHHRALSTGAAIPSPTHSPSFFNQTLILPSERGSPEAVKENGFLSNPATAVSATVVADQESKEGANVTEKEKEKASPSANGTLDNGSGKHIHEESDLLESLDHNLNLPDSPFASPKAVGDFITAFNSVDEAGKTNSASASSSANGSLITSALLPATSTLDMASFNSCYFQAPRFSSGHGAIGM